MILTIKQASRRKLRKLPTLLMYVSVSDWWLLAKNSWLCAAQTQASRDFENIRKDIRYFFARVSVYHNIILTCSIVELRTDVVCRGVWKAFGQKMTSHMEASSPASSNAPKPAPQSPGHVYTFLKPSCLQKYPKKSLETLFSNLSSTESTPNLKTLHLQSSHQQLCQICWKWLGKRAKM